MELYQICYRARINWSGLRRDLDSEIDRALAQIRRINRRGGVTGALLLGKSHFLQFLEGAPGPVLDTLYCVMQDRRVTDLEAVFHEPATERLFPNSLMFHRNLASGAVIQTYPGLHALIDEQDRLTRGNGYSALACFSGDVRESGVTNGMMLV